MMLIIGALGLALVGLIGYALIMAFFYILVGAVLIFGITACILFYIIYYFTGDSILSAGVALVCTIAIFSVYARDTEGNARKKR